jgi:hypothetical protein
MHYTTIKRALLALILASVLPLAACSDDDNPTSPTQPGPPVGETPTPPPTDPAPPPDDDDDDDDDNDDDDRPIETITGTIANLRRSGAGDLDASFRIDDRTIARVSRDTPVVSGSQTGDTNFLREGLRVTVQGRRDNGFLDATRVDVLPDAP